MIQSLKELPRVYDEAERIMRLPYSESQEKSRDFYSGIKSNPNLFVRLFFPAMEKVRAREFGMLVRLELVRAAAAYKSGGSDALKNVKDPLTGEPFELSPVQFEGVHRGFKLKSKAKFRDMDEVMIFLEKPGKHFYLDGKNAGSPYK